jgi:hypothetical protein
MYPDEGQPCISRLRALKFSGVTLRSPNEGNVPPGRKISWRPAVNYLALALR